MHIVVATGRSIVATTPILNALGLTRATSCAPTVRSPWPWTRTSRRDTRSSRRSRSTQRLPSSCCATPGRTPSSPWRSSGVGFKVSAPFPDGELDGELRVVLSGTSWWPDPVTRVTFRSPTGTSGGLRGAGGAHRPARGQLQHRLHRVDGHQPRGRLQGVGPRAAAPAPGGRAHAHRRRSATSATTSRCCSGLPAGWRWATRPRRSRPSPTRWPATSTTTAWCPCCSRCSP